jgi:hypothetical protein
MRATSALKKVTGPYVTEAYTTLDNHNDKEFLAFMERVHARFLNMTEQGTRQIFRTDAEGLWELYLGTFGAKPRKGRKAAAKRQYHTCNCCRRFIENYGNLAIITAEGAVESIMWNPADAPAEYEPALNLMKKAVEAANVTGIFLSPDWKWGDPESGGWLHFALPIPPVMRYKPGALTAGQAMAEKLEDFKNVTRALEDYSLPQLETAVTLLESESLYRSEKLLGGVKWLRDLKQIRNHNRGRRRNHLLWHMIGRAPAGFCHPRSGMAGTLLDDLANGMSYADVKRRFDSKMNPMKYQRPVAAPKAGTIVAAEKLVDQLAAAGSLRRRQARLDDIQAALWVQPLLAEPTTKSGVFSGLQAKGAGGEPSGQLRVDKGVMTWAYFTDKVLRTLDKLEVYVPPVGHFVGLVTAAVPSAPPILEWDLPDRRNPVSWYLYRHNPRASEFSLQSGHYTRVKVVTEKPSMWTVPGEHHGKGAILIIEGAKDRQQPGLCLFPEILKSEFHGVRSVMEAYSRSKRLEEVSNPAAGLMISPNSGDRICLRGWRGGVSMDCIIDRWE